MEENLNTFLVASISEGCPHLNVGFLDQLHTSDDLFSLCAVGSGKGTDVYCSWGVLYLVTGSRLSMASQLECSSNDSCAVCLSIPGSDADTVDISGSPDCDRDSVWGVADCVSCWMSTSTV